MATPAYMSITGTKQGLITAGAFTEDSVGNTYQEGHEDQVMVQGFNHEVIIPRDPQSGQPTGQRVHKPVVITKVFDKASPLLLAALTSGERLTKVEIQWYRTSAAGTQEHYYTTVLEDAIIVDIKDYMHNCQDPGNAHFTPPGRRALHLPQDHLDPRSLRHLRLRRLALPGRRLSRDRRTRPASLAVVPSMTHSAVARKARAGSMPLCLL
ncbi:Major exported protein [Pseudomonas aeruginosa]|nr:Major exported protein [Pseudomonas aeruginosa]